MAGANEWETAMSASSWPSTWRVGGLESYQAQEVWSSRWGRLEQYDVIVDGGPVEAREGRRRESSFNYRRGRRRGGGK